MKSTKNFPNNRAVRPVRKGEGLSSVGGAVIALFLAVFILQMHAGESAARNASEPDTVGAPPGMRLLTSGQYANTIAAIFGADVAKQAKANFASINRLEGLVAVGAGTALVTSGSLARLEVSARIVALMAVDEAHRNFIVPCEPVTVNARDDACARKFLGQVGRLLYRRPLSRVELDEAVHVTGQSIGQAGDFYFGLSAALSGMLVAPQFTYVQENAERDPAGGWRLDGYSKASRLSFLLWDSAPDDILLTAAEKGELDTPEGLSLQVRRMIASSRLEMGIRSFFNDMLILEKFDTLAKDPVIYPAFTLKIASDSREQMHRVIVDHLIAREGDYRDLFTTRRTFLTRDLGMIYGVPVTDTRGGWASYEFSQDDPRSGLLQQVGFLVQYSHAGKSSPTNRGRGLRETLLCQHVPDPPGNVDLAGFVDVTAKTARERLSAHRSEPICAGCHRITDPIGLALENFDGAGQYRETENGVPIDASGDLDGVKFTDAGDFVQVLSKNPVLTSCLVNRLYSYGVGRKIEENEFEWIKYLETRFAEEGYRVPDLLRTIAMSDAFYSVESPDLAALGD